MEQIKIERKQHTVNCGLKQISDMEFYLVVKEMYLWFKSNLKSSGYIFEGEVCLAKNLAINHFKNQNKI